MDILNKNGQILLDYRTEFKRHYATSVDEALKNAVYFLYKEGRINEKLFRMILDEDVDDLEIYTYLLTKKDFTKSPEELNYEYDKVRQKVNDYLISIGMIFNVSTKNDLNQNKIVIMRQFDVSKEVLLQYFGLTPTEVIPLMKRRGFMDKFCVLRLNQIFKEIYSELRMPEHIDQGYSLVYYNKEIQGFSIDYKYSVNVNYLADENHMRETLNKIKELDRLCEKKFQNKMNFVYFSSQGGSKKKDVPELKMPEATKKVAPVIPVPPEKSSIRTDIRAPEIIVDSVKPSSQPQEQPKQPQKPNQGQSTQLQKKAPPAPPKPQEKQPQQQQKPTQNQKKEQAQPKHQQPQKSVKQNNPEPPEKQEEKVVETPVTPTTPTFVDVPMIPVDEDDKDLL